jgi:hypothetical protein
MYHWVELSVIWAVLPLEVLGDNQSPYPFQPLEAARIPWLVVAPSFSKPAEQAESFSHHISLMLIIPPPPLPLTRTL